MKFKETEKRILAKTILIRVLFTFTVVGNLYLSGASWSQIWTILPFATVVSMIAYWLHERTWNKAQWNRKPRNNFFFTEGQPRTVVKSVTWRILISITNVIIPYLATGSWGSAAIYLGLATVINAAVYYIHERSWLLVNWGQIRNEL